MGGLNESSCCKFCLNNTTEKGFQVITGVIRDILDVLLLKLKFHSESKEIICNACRRKLNAALEFKSTCLNTDKKIIPYVDCQAVLQVDLAEVYMKENGNGRLGVSYNLKVCRLCMQLIKSEIRCIGDEELEAIHKFVPEMNIRIIKDPIVCKPCFDSLCTHNTFLKDCLDVEQTTGDIFDGSAMESQMDTSPSDLSIKNETVDNDSEMNEGEMSIKTECIDIKSEEDEGRSDTVLLCSSETFENSDCNNVEEEELESIWKQKNRLVDGWGMETRKKTSSTYHQLKSDESLYKCDKCIYETKSKTRFTSHCEKHNIILEEYKCKMCEYVTKKKILLKSHILRHKDPSEVQMYKCELCDYESKRKRNITIHMLIHKDPSQVQMYKCDACNYECKYKSSLSKHQLIHKESSEVQMYRCNDCDFKTKYKGSIATHVLQHKDHSQVRMYKCDACDYKSTYKGNFAKHRLTHKGPSEVQMYTCNECNFETKYKGSIADHVLRHKDPSQVWKYKCDVCDYKSIDSGSITKHQLIHKGPLEVQMYRCEICEFVTKHKVSLKTHTLRHNDSSSKDVQL